MPLVFEIFDAGRQSEASEEIERFESGDRVALLHVGKDIGGLAHSFSAPSLESIKLS